MHVEIIRDPFGFPFAKLNGERLVMCTSCGKPVDIKASKPLCEKCETKPEKQERDARLI